MVYYWVNTEYTAIKSEVGISGAVALSIFIIVHVGLQGTWFVTMCKKLVGMAKLAFSTPQNVKES